ncbi:MAG: trigger factor [Oscillospiraceae bacterium]
MSLVSNNKLENNKYEMTFEINAEDFEKAVNAAFMRAKNSISVPGFRKGKAPRKMVEKLYGENAFYEDAVNYAVPEEIEKAAEENGLVLVTRPEITVDAVSKDEGVKFKAVIITKPEVSISDYLGIEVKKPDNTVTDDDIDNELNTLRNRNARLVSVDDRAAQSGDIAVLDFEGFKGDVAFEGGKAENYELELGSGQFIPGFEDQVIGHKVDEEFDINVTFPETYHVDDLKGQPVVFKIKLHEIKVKELPEVDDEFIKDTTEFESLDEYKNDLKTKLADRKAKQADEEVESAVLDAVISKLEADIPEVMYENKINELVSDFGYRVKAQGMDLDIYLQYMGMTMEGFKEGFKDRATMEVKLRLALEKIAELENIEVSDEELEEEYKRLAEIYRVSLKEAKKHIPAEGLRMDLKVGKASKLVREKAVIA